MRLILLKKELQKKIDINIIDEYYIFLGAFCFWPVGIEGLTASLTPLLISALPERCLKTKGDGE